MNIDGVTISDGNSKVGKVPSVSLPPGCGCPPDAPCFSKGCYAKKLLGGRPDYARSLRANMRALVQDRGRFFSAIDSYLAKKLSNRFRWHVAGDIVDLDYLRRMVILAESWPNVQFLCFTKRYELLERFWEPLPMNFRVFLSMWPGYRGPSHELCLRFSRAWMRDPKFMDARFNEERAANSVTCPGGCTACKWQCWEAHGKDVVFHKH